MTMDSMPYDHGADNVVSLLRESGDPGWQEMPDWVVGDVSADVAASNPGAAIRIVAGELHEMATQGERALINAGQPFYSRGESIVRPVVDEMPAAHGQVAKVPRLCKVDRDTMVDYLSRSADWLKFNARKKAWLASDPPDKVASTILSRDGEWGFPKLAGVITTPTLRPDGTILAEVGYDPATRLLLLDPPALPPISNRPTKKEAQAALAELNALLDEFPFVNDASRSVALSALITPVVRGAMPVVPLTATSASVAGSGKSYVIDVAATISTGQPAPVIAAGRNEEETEKRLVAALFSGQSIISIDNVNGQLGGDFLCQMIERPVVTPRILGLSKNMRIESRATCFATGNNIQLVGDMTRRVILCSLDANMERPELRQFRAKPVETVLADRGKYIAAALTVVRAYIVAGCPGELPALASFEAWSRMVRSALVWLGCADPVDTMEAARAEDPITTSLRAIYAAWHNAVGSSARSTGQMKELADERNSFGNLTHGDLHRALCEASEKRPGEIDTRKLGHFLGRHRGRIIDGLKLQDFEDSHSKQRMWSVERVM